jgi:hypothetical protein
MSNHTLTTGGVAGELWLIILVVVSCGVPRHAMDANQSAPAAHEKVPAVCKKTGQRPGSRQIGQLDITDPSHAAYTPYHYVAHAATIRILAKGPLSFQVVDPGSRAQEGSMLAPASVSAMGSTPVTAQAATMLGQLEIGEIVAGHFLVPEGIYDAEPPPVILASLASLTSSAVPAAEVPLVAEWREDGGGRVAVYADGHAFVSARSDLIDAPLSAAELDSFLQAFASADFDALPEDQRHVHGAVVLACERYQQVDIDAHRHALAPVLSAFARIRDRAMAQVRPLLVVERRGWHAPILAWPASAPPVGMLYDLKSKAVAQVAAGDYSSPLYRSLPDELVAAFPAAQPWPVVVSDRGERWELFEHSCDTCRPGTYSMIYAQHATFEEAPDWVPDLASIGEDGLVLDGNDARYEALRSRSYRQRGGIYIVQLRQIVPRTKR